jgi:eukaryotic-like serine/threonine-protein kinase
VALPAGARLGPYEILSSLGAGGMGEVYRARDTRLGRDVAIKIVPPTVADNAIALGRFEREAKAVAALSHPNILTIYDFGQSRPSTSSGQALPTDAGREVTYAVMELLEGQTLRERLSSGALPVRKALDLAAQIAHGLAAAHDKQIAHRDLKPENVFITTSGAVKILDFGLARQTGPATAAVTPPDSPTVVPGTEPGVVLGTVGYMAPEQVRGEPSDHHADTFALGCVLYEMLTGRRAYQRDTPPETMTAILKEDPPDPSTSGVAVPPAVQRIIRRCLEKRPEERFQSTRDLAFALESALDASSASGHDAVAQVRSRRWLAALPMLALGLALGVGLGAIVTRKWQPQPWTSPAFRRLTFERGTIRDARFTPDGESVIYGAAWEGNPLRIFMARTDAPESVRLSLPDARLLSISRTGEMAISLHHTFEGWMGSGTLARSSVLGSAPRVLAENIREADWMHDGADLAVVRRVNALEQLEFPVGRVVYRTSGFISDIRISPSGDRIAFADHPLFADDAGGVSIVDREGKRTALADGFNSIRGLAWSPNGNEIWFTGTRAGQAEMRDAIFAVTLDGRRRVVWSSPSFLKLFDVAPDGRVLMGTEISERRVEALFSGASSPADVSLRAASVSFWMSDDGSAVTLADQATENYSAYLMTSGTSAVRLGDGQPFGISPDGRWVLALPVTGSPILLHPTGAGSSRELPNPEKLVFDIAAWLPDSRVVMFGQVQGRRSRGYVQDIDGGPPRPFTKEGVGVGLLRWWKLPVSPDGSRVIARNEQGDASIFHIDTGATEPIAGLRPDDLPVQWLADPRAILVAHGNGVPWIVERLDLATGRRTLAFEVRARDAAGLRLSALAMARDGRHWAHSYSRLLTDLFIVEGLH